VVFTDESIYYTREQLNNVPCKNKSLGILINLRLPQVKKTSKIFRRLAAAASRLKMHKKINNATCGCRKSKKQKKLHSLTGLVETL